MKIRELNNAAAEQIFNEIVEKGIPNNFFDDLDDDYRKIRNDLLSFKPQNVKDPYKYDLALACKIWNYFNNKNFPEINEAVVSNYEFWMYICLKVVPDIIKERHGLQNTYFYKKKVRMYIPTLWWFIELSFNNSIEETFTNLSKFNTDIILQFVERPGRNGLYKEVIRTIFKYLFQLPIIEINKKIDGKNLIRRLLIQNTAISNNYNLILEDDPDTYVKKLFSNCGVEL